MGDPACHLSSTCLACGRFSEGSHVHRCPHCGAAIDDETGNVQPNPVFVAENVNTILYCEAFEATVNFYRTLLGLEVTFSNDWFFEFRLGDRARLSIADPQRATIPPVDGKGMTLSLEVVDFDDLRHRLTGLGIEATPTSKRFGARVFDIHDPEGHRIEFWARS
ncbi:MAG TPA: VOC family protein [Acidimicrobiia bacterium]|nr:VOC family protein [Acidimicrobiia bacterium]